MSTMDVAAASPSVLDRMGSEEEGAIKEYDGNAPSTYDPGRAGTNLTPQERAALSQVARRAEAEEEDHPLTALQMCVTLGQNLTPARAFECPPDVEAMCCDVNPSGDTAAIGCRNSKLMLLNLSTMRLSNVHDLGGEAAQQSALGDKQVPALTALRFRPDGHGGTSNVAYLAQGSSILATHTTQGHVTSRRQEEGNSINTLSVRPLGPLMLASAGQDKVVRVYDEASGKLAVELDHGDDVSTAGHGNVIFSTAWKPDDPNVLASGGWDRCVNLWDLRVRRAVLSCSGPYVCGGAALAFRGDQLLIASWRERRNVQLWDVRSGRLDTTCPWHQPCPDACLPYAAQFLRGGRPEQDLIAAGGSGEQPCVKVFYASGQMLGTLACHSAVNTITEFGDPEQQSGKRSAVICCATRVLVLQV